MCYFLLYLLWCRANAGFRRLLITFKWLDLKPLKSGVIIPWTRSKIFALIRGFFLSAYEKYWTLNNHLQYSRRSWASLHVAHPVDNVPSCLVAAAQAQTMMCRLLAIIRLILASAPGQPLETCSWHYKDNKDKMGTIRRLLSCQQNYVFTFYLFFLMDTSRIRYFDCWF